MITKEALMSLATEKVRSLIPHLTPDSVTIPEGDDLQETIKIARDVFDAVTERRRELLGPVMSILGEMHLELLVLPASIELRQGTSVTLVPERFEFSTETRPDYLSPTEWKRIQRTVVEAGINEGGTPTYANISLQMPPGIKGKFVKDGETVETAIREMIKQLDIESNKANTNIYGQYSTNPEHHESPEITKLAKLCNERQNLPPDVVDALYQEKPSHTIEHIHTGTRAPRGRELWEKMSKGSTVIVVEDFKCENKYTDDTLAKPRPFFITVREHSYGPKGIFVEGTNTGVDRDHDKFSIRNYYEENPPIEGPVRLEGQAEFALSYLTTNDRRQKVKEHTRGKLEIYVVSPGTPAETEIDPELRASLIRRRFTDDQIDAIGAEYFTEQKSHDFLSTVLASKFPGARIREIDDTPRMIALIEEFKIKHTDLPVEWNPVTSLGKLTDDQVEALGGTKYILEKIDDPKVMRTLAQRLGYISIAQLSADYLRIIKEKVWDPSSDCLDRIRILKNVRHDGIWNAFSQNPRAIGIEEPGASLEGLKNLTKWPNDPSMNHLLQKLGLERVLHIVTVAHSTDRIFILRDTLAQASDEVLTN